MRGTGCHGRRFDSAKDDAGARRAASGDGQKSRKIFQEIFALPGREAQLLSQARLENMVDVQMNKARDQAVSKARQSRRYRAMLRPELRSESARREPASGATSFPSKALDAETRRAIEEFERKRGEGE